MVRGFPVESLQEAPDRQSGGQAHSKDAGKPRSARRPRRYPSMRILVHDYAGHPFQVQLSRALAARGHEVLHLYSGSISTPQAMLDPRPDDPPEFQSRAITLDRQVAKYDHLKRYAQELAYAKLLETAAAAYRPNVVICSNTPIDVVARLARFCRRASVPWINWLQDLHSIAIERYFGRKVPLLGPLVSFHYARKEGRLLRAARFVVAISEGFLPAIERLSGTRDNIELIENWAPLDQISPRPRDNAWARAQGLESKFCFLYSGTLGLKHNPERLAELAQHFAGDDDVRVVVVSEGKGSDYLSAAKERLGLDNLVLLPWQPFEDLPNVLGTADVLLALLEPDASALSVPSKVMSNLAAGRPQLLAVPGENLAAQTVAKAEAGLVAAPDDGATWLRHATCLRNDAGLRRELGENAWAYAEKTFDIDRIADRFEDLMAYSLS